MTSRDNKKMTRKQKLTIPTPVILYMAVCTFAISFYIAAS